MNLYYAGHWCHPMAPTNQPTQWKLLVCTSITSHPNDGNGRMRIPHALTKFSWPHRHIESPSHPFGEEDLTWLSRGSRRTISDGHQRSNRRLHHVYASHHYHCHSKQELYCYMIQITPQLLSIGITLIPIYRFKSLCDDRLMF